MPEQNDERAGGTQPRSELTKEVAAIVAGYARLLHPQFHILDEISTEMLDAIPGVSLQQNERPLVVLGQEHPRYKNGVVLTDQHLLMEGKPAIPLAEISTLTIVEQGFFMLPRGVRVNDVGVMTRREIGGDLRFADLLRDVAAHARAMEGRDEPSIVEQPRGELRKVAELVASGTPVIAGLAVWGVIVVVIVAFSISQIGGLEALLADGLTGVEVGYILGAVLGSLVGIWVLFKAFLK